MDVKQEFERVLEGMEWGEVVSTLIDAINDLSTPPQPPLPLPSLDPNQHLQVMYPVGGIGWSEEFISVPTFALPPFQEQFLYTVGYPNGEPVYRMVPNMYGAAGPALQSAGNNPKKRNRTVDHPYIKRPMNAFMIFRGEQREKVMEDLNIRDSAAVNAVLGKMWWSLSKQEQAVFYEKARVEKELHSQQHPGWSAMFNYVCTPHRVTVQHYTTTVEAKHHLSAQDMLLPTDLRPFLVSCRVEVKGAADGRLHNSAR
ncbi:transcription factor 7-like 1-B [Nelusetta ayraudi]|uniref:transcription factor 7-like 1-B n=1 Tax=Nelusetta ayraudi TaxID=303726 RepID=UPI003F7051AC